MAVGLRFAPVGQVGAFLLLERSPEIARLPDHELSEAVAQELESPSVLPARLLRTIAELAAQQPAAPLFDFMYERYLEAHSRRVDTVSGQVAELMVALAGVDTGTVLDPVCGLGSVLTAAARAGAERLAGQEREEHAAHIAAVRLHLHGHQASIQPGDALKDDRFASLQADAVVCVPPFGERNWGTRNCPATSGGPTGFRRGARPSCPGFSTVCTT